MTIPLDQLNLDKTGSGAGVLSALATMAGGSTSHLFLGVRKLSRKSSEVNLSSVQMVSLFWGVPQKEISKVRAFNLSKKNGDKMEVSSGSYLSLLPQHQDKHLPEQDIAFPVSNVCPVTASSDLALTELDHIVLVGYPGLEGSWERC